MKKIQKTLNGIQSSLLLWGNPFDEEAKQIIICVTGNPGLVDFYSEFGEELHERLMIPVCVIGQAGHEEVSEKKSLEQHSNLFNLEGQIAHKHDFISNCIDKKSKLHLVGHSIGAWQIIELLDKKPELLSRISSINLLFPTIQKMVESPNGKFLNNFLRRIHFLVLILLNLFKILPDFIKKILIHLYLSWCSLPAYYYERVYKVLSPNIMEKVLFLAYDEMDTVTNLNKDGIEKIKHLTNVLYSDTDHWVPLTYMEGLKMFRPQLSLSQLKVDHAFVLKSSEIVAEKVVSFIEDKC